MDGTDSRQRIMAEGSEQLCEQTRVVKKHESSEENGDQSESCAIDPCLMLLICSTDDLCLWDFRLWLDKLIVIREKILYARLFIIFWATRVDAKAGLTMKWQDKLIMAR